MSHLLFEVFLFTIFVKEMDADNNKSMESVESTTDDGEPIVQLSEYNARESIGVPMFKVCTISCVSHTLTQTI